MRRIYLILFCIALVPKLLFLFLSNYDMQGLYDIQSHVYYIKYIASNFDIPTSDNCFQCFQPPAYYLTAAGIYKFAFLIGIHNEDMLIKILQMYSFLLYHLFLLVGILVIDLVLRKTNKAIIGVSLLLFWPSGTIHSVRIGNDVPVYLTISLALYFLIRWWRQNNGFDLVGSVTFTLLGILIKTNAIILLPIIVVSYLIKLHKDKNYIKKLIKFSLFVLIPLLVVILINQRNVLLSIKQDDWLIGNYRSINKIAYVGNAPINYLWFDLGSYLKHPNIHPWDDLGGRQYFWNYLLKTSLFGELSINHPMQQRLAILLSFLSLGLVICLLIKLFTLKRLELRQNFPLLLSLVLFIASIIFLKIKLPCSCSNDFRYIYPALIPIVTLISQCYTIAKTNIVFKYGYLLLIGSFIFISYIFHVIL